MMETLVQWEPVIGLEIHVQLNTKSKLFSTAPNHFGDEPNLNITVADIADLGALPVLNKEAVRKAVQFGLAIGGKIELISRFDRKSYFYPDNPRNFQITQYTHPLIQGGSVQVEMEGVVKTFPIQKTHLEDDAGMLKHFAQYSGIDFNRAGAPLIEIVSEPCLHSPKEAIRFAMAIRSIMLYLDASDGNMEEGSFRFDANISVRPKGEKGLRPRIEIKNLNSFSHLEAAIETEVSRQIALYTAHPQKSPAELIFFGTYRWDPVSKQSILMRAKETAEDYRYFPEPDLMPLILTQEWIDEIRMHLPELPQHRFRRYISDLGLTPHAATVLINEKTISDYFEEALKYCSNPRLLCNWITIEFAGRLKEKNLPNIGILPIHVAKLVQMIDEHRITARIAKSVADEMVRKPGLDPETIVKNNPDFQPMGSTDAIEKIVDAVLDANPQSVVDFKAGHKKAFSYLIGQVMKETKGAASPQIVSDLLIKKLEP